MDDSNIFVFGGTFQPIDDEEPPDATTPDGVLAALQSDDWRAIQAKHMLHMYTVCGICEGLLGIASQCLCSTDWNICTATKCNYFVFCVKTLFPTFFFAGVTGSTVSIWAETAIRGRSVVVSQWAQIINSTDSTWVRYNHPSLLIPCAVLTIGIFRFRWIVRRFDRQVCKSIWIPW